MSLVKTCIDAYPKADYVAIAGSVEPMEQTVARLEAALRHVDRERLLAATDRESTVLDRNLAMARLANVSRAARAVQPE